MFPVREVLAPQALSPPPVLGTLIEVKLARAYCQPHELLDGPIGVFCGSGVCCCRRKNVLARVVCPLPVKTKLARLTIRCHRFASLRAKIRSRLGR